MADSAETLTAQAEKYTAASARAFKEAVDKSLNALNELNAQSKQNLEAVVASATAATKGAEALGAQAIAYSKKSLEDGVSAARALGSARSLQDVVELQTSYAKSALEGYLVELNKATETVAAAFKESLTPLNARFSATIEKFQVGR